MRDSECPEDGAALLFLLVPGQIPLGFCMLPMSCAPGLHPRCRRTHRESQAERGLGDAAAGGCWGCGIGKPRETSPSVVAVPVGAAAPRPHASSLASGAALNPLGIPDFLRAVCCPSKVSGLRPVSRGQRARAGCLPGPTCWESGVMRPLPGVREVCAPVNPPRLWFDPGAAGLIFPLFALEPSPSDTPRPAVPRRSSSAGCTPGVGGPRSLRDPQAPRPEQERERDLHRGSVACAAFAGPAARLARPTKAWALPVGLGWTLQPFRGTSVQFVPRRNVIYWGQQPGPLCPPLGCLCW